MCCPVFYEASEPPRRAAADIASQVDTSSPPFHEIGINTASLRSERSEDRKVRATPKLGTSAGGLPREVTVRPELRLGKTNLTE